MNRRAWLCKFVVFCLGCRAGPVRAQTAPRTIGYLGPPAPDASGQLLFDELRGEIHRLGWVEGKDLRYVSRLPGPPDATGAIKQRIAAFARELASSGADVLVAISTGSAKAAQQASSTIPIIFLAEKPVENGFVSSLARPAGNMSGMTYHNDLLTLKRMQLLAQAAPGLARVAYLSRNEPEVDAVAITAAKTLNLELQPVPILRAEDLEPRMGAALADGWLVEDYFFFMNHMDRIVELIARTRKPAIFGSSDWVHRGGLMS